MSRVLFIIPNYNFQIPNKHQILNPKFQLLKEIIDFPLISVSFYIPQSALINQKSSSSSHSSASSSLMPAINREGLEKVTPLSLSKIFIG